MLKDFALVDFMLEFFILDQKVRAVARFSVLVMYFFSLIYDCCDDRIFENIVL